MLMSEPTETTTDTPQGGRLAIVEDDRSVRDMLQAVLTHEGHDVQAFADGRSCLAAAGTMQPDLVLLDIGLPDLDGVAVCKRLRQEGFAGSILMLTARHETAERVRGLDAGADDYLVKPFALDELLARVRALLRRPGILPSASGPETLAVGRVVLDPSARTVHVDGDGADLTRLEFDLLALLMDHSPNVLTRAQLHEHIWGYDGEHMSNSLEVCISQLRRKIERGGADRIVQTVRGVGYAARLAP